MNRIFSASLLTAALTFGTHAMAAPVLDTYVGGSVTGYGDIVGHASIFDVMSFDVQRSASSLIVDIATNFAGDAGVYRALTNTVASGGNGIAYGDVFLANDWAPFGPAPYTADNHDAGTHWRYAFSLDNRWSATGGSGVLYRLNGATNDSNALLSDDFLAAGIFRRGQVVAVDRQSSTVERIGTGSWLVDGPNNRLSFAFDVTGTTLRSDDSLALHWGMSCGNDVIEGQTTEVPVPAAAGLLAFGLLGARAFRRRGGNVSA